MKKNTQQQGFSLVELLVSISIFTAVMTMSVGTLLVLIDANAKAQNIQTVMTNITFALDSMTREIRTGSKYYCRTYNTFASIPVTSIAEHLANNCIGGHNFISIVEGGTSQASDANLTNSVSGNRIEYYFDDSYDGRGAILRRLGDGVWLPITPTTVEIDEVDIVTTGTGSFASGDTEQPTVSIILRGSAGIFADTDAAYVIQTTISQRLLDI